VVREGPEYGPGTEGAISECQVFSQELCQVCPSQLYEQLWEYTPSTLGPQTIPHLSLQIRRTYILPVLEFS
jgi:hypothetical protein